MAHVAHVDGKFLGVFWDLDVLLRQNKRALLSIQGKHSHTIANGENQCGLWAVNAITCCNLLATRLQKFIFGDAFAAFWFLQNAEDGANAHIDVNVARAV